MGRRASRLRMERIPPEVDANWIIVEISMDFEERITFLQVTNVPAKNLLGQTLKIIIPTAPDGRNG